MNERIQKKIDKVLFLRKDQIIADIEARIDLVADSNLRDDGTRNPIFENIMVRHKHLIDRWIEKYLDSSRSRMGAYVVVEQRHGSMNARRDWQEQTIHLSFPWNWDETTFNNLVLSVHDYIVNSVLMEFFINTLTSKAPITTDCQTQAAESYDMIKHYISARSVHTQKPLHPF